MASSISGTPARPAPRLDAPESRVTTHREHRPIHASRSRARDTLAATPGEVRQAANSPKRVQQGPALAAQAVRLLRETAARPTAATASATATTGYAAATTATPPAAKKGEFDFLKDPKIPFEEKLMRFMKLVAQKSEDEITKKMNEIAGNAKTLSSSGTAAAPAPAKKPKGLGGFLGKVLGSAVPQLVKLPVVRDFLKQVSGPVLGAAATALGFPALAPLLAKAGPGLADLVVDAASAVDVGALLGGLGGGSASGDAAIGSSGASSTSGTAQASEPKRAESQQLAMMELQQMIDKQKEMFTTLSNIMRANHDMRMSAIQNMR
jgi:hypothetical protein